MRKFKPRKINVGQNPVFIVGMSPSLLARPDAVYAWDHGTKSSDFLLDIIKSKENLYLTNIYNYQTDEVAQVEEGLFELDQDIELFKPRLIVCLGNFAYESVKSLKLDIEVIKIPHPSYILRFNHNKDSYRKELLDLL